MSRFWNIALTVGFATLFFVVCVPFMLIALSIWLVTLPFDREKKVLHKFGCFWGYLYMVLWPFFHVRFEGRKNIEAGRAYVLAANHQSLLDIMLLYGLFRHFKWVSKEENFKIPFVGWNMSLNQYVTLERGNRSAIVKMMRACEDYLGRGSSVLIFPEGTRSRDGELRPFKSGAVALAIRAGVPIVPIVHDGTWRAIDDSGKWLRGGFIPIKVRVLPPLEPREGEDADALSSRLRETMIHELRSIRGESATIESESESESESQSPASEPDPAGNPAPVKE